MRTTKIVIQYIILYRISPWHLEMTEVVSWITISLGKGTVLWYSTMKQCNCRPTSALTNRTTKTGSSATAWTPDAASARLVTRMCYTCTVRPKHSIVSKPNKAIILKRHKFQLNEAKCTSYL